MITCQYCGNEAHLVDGREIYQQRPDLYSLNFWQCKPCNAFVGCHREGAHVDGVISDGTIPLGILANAELRKAKSAAHAAFDPLWRNKHFKSRKTAYKWLADKLKINIQQCHIGMFDVAMSNRVVVLCNGFAK